jgi:hypothetical protein
MYGRMFGKVSEYFEKRYLTTVLLPTLTFWVALFSLMVVGAGWENVLKDWRSASLEIRVVLSAAALLALVLSANVISARLGNLVRLYEGYWKLGPFNRLVTDRARRRQQRYLQSLNLRIKQRDNEAYDYRFLAYPREEKNVLPTALGNIFRTAELYPSEAKRYNMHGVFFWPRLYAILPEGLRADLGNTRASLDGLLVIATLGWIFALFAFCYLIAIRVFDYRLWIVSIGGSLVLSRSAYRSSLAVAMAFGELVRTAFDLYRHDLIRQMGYTVPSSLAQERRFWENLVTLLYRGDTKDPQAESDLLVYDASKESQEKKEESAQHPWPTIALGVNGRSSIRPILFLGRARWTIHPGRERGP